MFYYQNMCLCKIKQVIIGRSKCIACENYISSSDNTLGSTVCKINGCYTRTGNIKLPQDTQM
jgi:hypothetical protein